ncbi:hypothetical protein GOBAR_AA31774 [Gossypium barbadense]|uniref:Uncharacterized protein n=1 Tax=Gossypium barbadense TaxID=3634 RepID=A0A2P5WCV2_GOSBA|nr:hypothetical protein GOBAR_AA31774 [Gossypium barbadense]
MLSVPVARNTRVGTIEYQRKALLAIHILGRGQYVCWYPQYVAAPTSSVKRSSPQSVGPAHSTATLCQSNIWSTGSVCPHSKHRQHLFDIIHHADKTSRMLCAHTDYLAQLVRLPVKVCPANCNIMRINSYKLHRLLKHYYKH